MAVVRISLTNAIATGAGEMDIIVGSGFPQIAFFQIRRIRFYLLRRSRSASSGIMSEAGRRTLSKRAIIFMQGSIDLKNAL